MPGEVVPLHESSRTLTKSQRKRMRREQEKAKKNALHLQSIRPLTDNQARAFAYWDDGFNLMLHGVAGTGKTFIGFALSLDEILNHGTYEKLVVVRSTVPTREQGFLPGGPVDKARVYEQPYMHICANLFGRGDAYDILKNKDQINFISTSYIRGSNLENCIVLVDECQNLNFHELDSIITRLGENSAIIFAGDFRQSDLINDYERKGLHTFKRIVSNMDSFRTVEFDREDIVRSELVKNYIIAKLDLGIAS